ncbi:MAG: hypothetical protein R3B47_19160 [Bacteroidia bacterium]
MLLKLRKHDPDGLICAGDTIDLCQPAGLHTEPPVADVHYTWSLHDQMDDRHLQHQRVAPEKEATYVLKATWLAHAAVRIQCGAFRGDPPHSAHARHCCNLRETAYSLLPLVKTALPCLL